MLKEEMDRLKNLYSYEVLDTGVDALLDSITTLAAYICETPVTLISLLDGDRQWFKSKVGVEVSEMPREVAFCNYAIMEKKFLQVENALEDPRFADNPLVTGDPHIRFYAGYPLISPAGYALGTLCVVDKKPRVLSEVQKDALLKLSQLVMACFEKTKQQKELEHALKSKEAILNLISHEIRTPLNAIMGVSYLLNNSDQTLVNSDDILLLKNSAEDLFDIVNELLDSGEIYRGNVKEQKVVFNLRTLLSELILEFKKGNDFVKINYDLSIPDFLVGDPLRLIQILRLSMKRFLNKGENKLTINLEQTEESVNAIYIQFSLGRSDGKPFLNEGFDLALLNKISSMLKAEVKKTDTEINILLPFDKVDEAHNGEEEKLEKDDLAGVKLLLVEDMETNRHIAGKFLGMWGIEFDVAHNGLEALEKVADKEYDLILMDIRMPEMDGFEATTEISLMKEGKYKDLPIIALTASVSMLSDEKMKKIGFQGFLTKPFNPKELKFTIKKVLQRNQY